MVVVSSRGRLRCPRTCVMRSHLEQTAAGARNVLTLLNIRHRQFVADRPHHSRTSSSNSTSSGTAPVTRARQRDEYALARPHRPAPPKSNPHDNDYQSTSMGSMARTDARGTKSTALYFPLGKEMRMRVDRFACSTAHVHSGTAGWVIFSQRRAESDRSNRKHCVSRDLVCVTAALQDALC